MNADTTVQAELIVVGGGIAGTCAALAAARLGCETVLINDRPVLGGNSSSEIRVWINGATGGKNNRYAREGGIMDELLQRNKHQNPGGSPDLWDAILIDAVEAEENLSLYLNTLITEVDTDGDRVVAVAGHQQMSETSFRFESPLFVDATGDGIVATQAGAEWIQGRESRETYDERAAPDTFDTRTLGSSIMFSSKMMDEPVEYVPPEFAHDFIEDTPEIIAQRTDPQERNECYWWVEYGGQEGIDPITDNEEIRDELWAIVYGIWDYIKNSGEFPPEEVDPLQLEWVGKIPGRRESRRIMGAYVLTEDDVVSQRRFEDRVGHGGWSIDLHPPSGIYDDQGRGSLHFHIDGPYSIPYRILYTRDIDNVFLAGRHVSASHVAFGTLRVQMTLATVGQAAGTAAALCARDEIDPDTLTSNTERLQQVLLRNDQWIIDHNNTDPTDHALDAEITASSTQSGNVTDPDTSVCVSADPSIGLHIAHEGRLDSLELLLASQHEHAVDLDVSVYTEDRPENTIPDTQLLETTVSVPPERTWVRIPVDHTVGREQGIFVELHEPAGIRIWGQERELSGIMALPRVDIDRSGRDRELEGFPQREAFWGNPGQHEMAPLEWIPCFQTVPSSQTALFAPENVANGQARPCGMGNSWVSARFDVDSAEDTARPSEPEWIELRWDVARSINTVQLTGNTRLNEWFNIYGTERRAEPETIRDYRIQTAHGGNWETVVEVSGNFQRFRRHQFETREADAVRVLIDATNGARVAELFEIRVYGPDHELPLPPR